MASTKSYKKRLKAAFVIPIRGSQWRVYIVSRKDLEALGSGDAYGFTSLQGKRIFIDSTLAYKPMLCTFMHEYMHACLGPASVGNSATLKLDTAAFEELVCDSIGESAEDLLSNAAFILQMIEKHCSKLDDETIEAVLNEMSEDPPGG